MIEVLRLLEHPQEIPALRCPVLIKCGEGNMLNVEVQRISHKDDQTGRKKQKHPQRRRITPDLPELLKDEGKKGAKHGSSSQE